MWTWFEHVLSCCSSKPDADVDRPRVLRHTVVLVGRGGVGKSTTGNTILGLPAFDCGPGGANSVDHKCEIATAARRGRILSLVDTPGFDDASTNLEETRNSIIQLTGGEVDAIAFMLPAMDVLVSDLQDGLENIRVLFGDEALARTVVVFTGGDHIKFTLKHHLGATKFEALKPLFKKYEGRMLVINNNTDQLEDVSQEFQLQTFLDKIDLVQRTASPFNLINE